MDYDFLIIGGGIVGLSTAINLQAKNPKYRIAIIEKEKNVCMHQSGRNSGVIHAGIYYAPNSLKAVFCKQGLHATKRFCRQNGVRFKNTGKLIVATNEVENERLLTLYNNSIKNGLLVTLINKEKLAEMEPNVSGISAIYSPRTGIVDYIGMCREMVKIIQRKGNNVFLNSKINGILESTDSVSVRTSTEEYVGKNLIVCGGIQADRLAKLANLDFNYQIVPFRGEYYKLNKAKNNIVSKLIYPVPEPSLPFLGVHITPMIDGSITVGPNAVLGLAREDYRKYSFNFTDARKFFLFTGFWRFLAKNLKCAFKEGFNSLIKSKYVKECKKYCKEIKLEDLESYPTGIRAQVVHKNGRLEHDFLFEKTRRSLHVINAPSPAATSAFPIGNYICRKFDHS